MFTMKKATFILSLILVFTLFFACSTSNDSNGNSTTTVVPISPTSLTGTVISTSQINLSWTDNSTNETGFKIERKTGTGAYAVVGSVNADVLTYNDLGLIPNTTYTYRVYAYNAAGNSPTYSNEVTLSTNNVIVLPILTTILPNTITSSTTWSGGNITSDGGATITARGVVWSTSTNPTIALATKTTDGIGIGNFTSSIVGLTANTTYYVKAYATNSVGTAYGTELSFTTTSSSNTSVTDIDGNAYQSITNCSQTWTKQNLNVSKYTDGTAIPQVTDPTQWANLTTGAWCYFNNDPTNGAIYGKLYNWYAIMGIYDSASFVNPALRKNIAPTGWHIPSIDEWKTMFICLDPNYNGGSTSNVAGGKMKEFGTNHWNSPNTGATNESGFSGLPGGYCFEDFTFHFYGQNGFWWSSSIENDICLYVYLFFQSNGINIGAASGASGKKGAISVRCIKN
jgi:uncharacterized protein (TIGR02145 family)